MMNRYRRSYDSEYTAPLVNHHIWPALMQGPRVVIKGEVNTRRGASLVSKQVLCLCFAGGGDDCGAYVFICVCNNS